MVAPTGIGGERFAGGREPLSGRPMVAPTDWRKNVAGVLGKSLFVRRLPVRDDEQYTDRCRGKVFERSMGATDQGAPPVVFEWVPPPPFQGRRCLSGNGKDAEKMSKRGCNLHVPVLY